ncbi:MAG: ABC transporter permease [Lachnospiraceae bacterium]|nr:ABC transporter permease [Lachnospiraceae bacterium]
MAEAKKKKKKSRFMDTFSRIFETPTAKLGGILLIIIVVLCVGAPLFTKYSPNEMDMTNMFCRPNAEHWCGTDNLGRDQWSRLLYGGRYSLALGIIGSLFAAIGGTGLGVIAGYFGGQVENLLMRFCDIWTAIPGTLLCIVISTALGSGFFNTILALSIGAIPNGARMTRGQILAERTKEYLEAAEAMNCSKLSIMFRHLLPNVISPTIVGTTMGIGATITQAATLSYIGLGVQPPNPEWGAMLSAGKNYVMSYPYLLLFPGLAIGFTTLAINLMGDGLRDALDPKLRK